MFICCVLFFFFKQKTAYELRISDWSSDVCSSDLKSGHGQAFDQRVDPDGGRTCPLHPARPCRHSERAAGREGFLRCLRTGPRHRAAGDRQSVVEGKGGSVRVDLGGSRNIKNKNIQREQLCISTTNRENFKN